MNCTVCDKSHSKEQPLTIAHNDEWLCPDCLKELDTFTKPTGKTGRVISVDEMLRMGDLHKSVFVSSKGTIKVGDKELPIKRFEFTIE